MKFQKAISEILSKRRGRSRVHAYLLEDAYFLQSTDGTSIRKFLRNMEPYLCKRRKRCQLEKEHVFMPCVEGLSELDKQLAQTEKKNLNNTRLRECKSDLRTKLWLIINILVTKFE